jgi:hypothetical protein
MNTKARITATRTAPWLAPRLWLALGVLAAAASMASRPAFPQEEAALEVASAEELQDLVGPIALYPDDLVAIVLPASTYPLQVVQAARFLEDRASDSSLQPNEEWDDSIVALLNYPEVVALLNDDLDWTYDLGTAVLNQRADVLSAIQDFRDEAYAAGNLRSDERQTVANEGDTIEIKPADPKVIYIPYYEPERVVVYQPEPVYYYYPRPYPVYYYPYPAHYHFNTGFFWGVNTWFSIGWHSHYVHAYDPFYYGHPYYGHSYYNPFYVRNVYVNHYHRYPNYVWEPRYRSGGRPFVRGTEGRVQTAGRVPPITAPTTDRVPRRGVLDSDAAATRTREGSANRATGSSAAGTATRALEGAATSSRGANGTAQPRRGVPSSSYRSRGAESTQPQAAQSAQAARPTRAAPGLQPQARPPGASAESSNAPPSTYRSGGGMSQALARNRAPAQASAEPRTNPSGARTNSGVSPRAAERSTGMPRESSRAAPVQREAAPSAPRPSAPSVSAPSHGGGASAQRSDSGGGGGGSYRGNSGGSEGGGSQRSAGSHPAARNSEGRSAGR